MGGCGSRDVARELRRFSGLVQVAEQKRKNEEKERLLCSAWLGCTVAVAVAQLTERENTYRTKRQADKLLLPQFVRSVGAWPGLAWMAEGKMARGEKREERTHSHSTQDKRRERRTYRCNSQRRHRMAVQRNKQQHLRHIHAMQPGSQAGREPGRERRKKSSLLSFFFRLSI